MVTVGRSIPLLVSFKIIFLTILTRAQCDVGCPVLVPSVCLQVTCQNLTRTGAVDCLSPGALIPQGTIATYRCIPHRGKDDGNRTYTMMCICDGKWMGIDRFVKFRDWCSGSTDTGPFIEEPESSPAPIPPEDMVSSSTSESGRILGGETTNPSVPTTTLKFLEAISTGLPLGTTVSSEIATTTPQPGPGLEATSPSNATGSEAGTTTLQTGTGSTPVPGNANSETTTTIQPGMGSTFAPGAGAEATTTLSPNTVAGEASNSTGSTPSEPNTTGSTTVPPTGTAATGNEGTTPISTNTAGQTTGAAQGTTTTYEGLTTIFPSSAGNVSSENMVNRNNSRESGGRNLFSGNASETTTASGETLGTTVQTTLASNGSVETTTSGTEAAGTGTNTMPSPATTGQSGVTGAAATSTPPSIESQSTTMTTPVEGGHTTVSSFITTTHEPPTTETGEAVTGNETGMTVSPIQVTTTIASLTTTKVPGTESPVAPPENIQHPENSTIDTSATNATSSNASSAPSPAEANCGEDHPTEGNYTDFQLVGLQLHNTYRRMHNVSDVKLNQTLNEKAQAWADHELTEKTLEVTPGKRNYAENLYKVSGWRAITPIRAVQEAMKTWYSSVDRYNWTQPNPTGFSQIVWKKTTDIGVGVAKKDDVTVVAVTYWPRGNIILVSSNGNETVDSGKLFRENVFPKVSDQSSL